MDKKIHDLLNKGVEEVIVSKDLEKKLLSGKKLRIKHGVDPTSKDLTIGHAVSYHKLKEFQEAGHKIVFLIGDYTARFGDPTDKEKSRTMREAKDVKKMSEHYIKQVGKILDLKKTEIRYNSEWYDKMRSEEMLHLMSRCTIARLLERDMFAKRMKEGKEIYLHEIVYPVLQGYDSVMLKSDMTIIGTDQKFNELMGRKMQEDFGQKPQDVMSVPLLVGTDGKIKMSQSLGNYIGITENAKDQFGKVMSIPDDVIIHYAELAARMNAEEIQEIKKMMNKNPRDAKIVVAKKIVDLYHPGESGQAEAEFNRIFKDKEIPDDIKTIDGKKYHGKNLVDVMLDAGLVKSKGEARRLIAQGGVKIDKAKIEEINEKLFIHDGLVLQYGKRNFVRFKLK